MATSFATEEAFVNATFCEFLKIWGNGNQAQLQVQCFGGQAWVQLMSALGPPSSPHLFRQDNNHHGHNGPTQQHGPHGPHHPSQHRRRKGAKQRDRDRARAALHRASILEEAAAPATASETLHHAQLLLPPPSPLHTSQDHLPEHHRGSLLQVEEVVRHHPHPGEGDVHQPPHHATLAVQAEHVSPLSLPPHSGSPPPVQQHTPPSQHLAHEQAHPHPRQAAAPLTILPGQASPFPPPAPSYSSIALTSPPRPPDQPGSSPAGWGVGDEPHHAAPPPVHEGGPQQVPHHHEHVAPTLVRRKQYCGADLSSFCFFTPEPSEHPPPSSSRRPFLRLHPRESLSEMRKPVKHLKFLLSQNIERAVMNRRGVCGGWWVWNVSVKRDFEENMVWDSTSFHGVSFSEEYEEYEPLGHFRLENDL